MKIYIDVDGVLVDSHMKPAKCVAEFLKAVTENHECYWLTTHAMDGNLGPLFQYLDGIMPKNAMECIKKIKPNPWLLHKTNGIDMDSDFLWFDDTPNELEREVLTKRGKQNNLIIIDLDRMPDQLRKIVELVRSRTV